MNISDDRARERAPNADERHPDSLGLLAIDDSRGTYATQIRLPNRAALLIIAAFWLAQISISSTQLFLMAMPEQVWKLLIPRVSAAAVGALISYGMLRVLDKLRDRSLAARAVAALILAMSGSALLALFNYPIFKPFVPPEELSPLHVAMTSDFLARLWIFIAISATFLALSYVLDIRERENRIHALQALAHSAQLRALRNQLNPHFLFNALNSIAGLISAKRPTEAEGMTINLADFLRQTIAQDPQQLITLDEELTLQGLYLDIERVRFPGRLDLKVDVPADVRNALVPSLITQPLIENSIKYAVARSTLPVELKIRARRSGDRLELLISNTGGDASAAPSKGANLGLRNVAERLRMHYGDDAEFTAEPDAKGGFRNVVTIPFRSAK